MALRKVNIGVECTDDAQRDRIQAIMNEVSGMGLLNGTNIEGMYPYFRSHQGELIQLFNLVGKGGVKALMSGQGIGLVTKLARR